MADLDRAGNNNNNNNSFYVAKPTLALPKNVPDIPEFYAGLNVLITGGTGFMGKVLIEKLLHDCPDVAAIYLLIRPKRNKQQTERLKDIFDLPLFDRIKASRPSVLEKVKIINGDVAELGLGLDEDDKKFLLDNVHVVFHVAASVRFDDPLKKAILLNTRGTRETIRLAKQMKQLKIFSHISTAYCNVDKDYIEEKIYKNEADWKTMIKMAETMDASAIDALETKILSKFPNTYTFTKSLSEDVVNEERGSIPTVIYRPTVVVSAVKHPLPGWIDNFNGPIGLLMGASKGVVHVIYCRKENKADYLVVDLAINGIISSAWYKALVAHDKDKCLVINSSTNDFLPFYNKNFLVQSEHMWNNPLVDCLWFPFCFISETRMGFLIMTILLHVIPGVLFDLILKLKGSDIRLMKIYRRAYFTNMALELFMIRQWQFENTNFRSLEAILINKDRQNFSINYSVLNIQESCNIIYDGMVKYLAKDVNKSEEYLNKKRLQIKRLYFLHLVTVAVFCVFILYSTSLIFRNVIINVQNKF